MKTNLEFHRNFFYNTEKKKKKTGDKLNYCTSKQYYAVTRKNEEALCGTVIWKGI